MGNDTKIEREQSSQSGELSDQQLDDVSGGMIMAIGYSFQVTVGHVVYDCDVSVGLNGVSASARGIASR